MTDENDNSPKAKGGLARAKALSPEERKAIARKAALSRWDVDLPIASNEGDFSIGNKVISAAVLPNGKRLITQSTFMIALGRSRTPKAGTGVFSTVDGIPFFLQAEALKPFITEGLISSTTPYFYRTKTGGRGVGYDAELLPRVCEVYLRYRDDCLAKKGKIPKRYAHIIAACDLLIRAFAHVGIIALIDEATGYQADRDREELQKILAAYISKDLLPWAQRFPEEFYEELFRLRGWQFRPLRGRGPKGPRYAGKLTNELIYKKLPPGVLQELRKLNPADNNWQRRHKHFQYLTGDIGNGHLEKQVAVVTTLMRISKDWKTFRKHFADAFPPPGKQYTLFDITKPEDEKE
jgi:hypothetical protein